MILDLSEFDLTKLVQDDSELPEALARAVKKVVDDSGEAALSAFQSAVL